jgi:hypothetical protein
VTKRNVALAIVLTLCAPVLCFLAAFCLGLVFTFGRYALFGRPKYEPVSTHYGSPGALSSAVSSSQSAPPSAR